MKLCILLFSFLIICGGCKKQTTAESVGISALTENDSGTTTGNPMDIKLAFSAFDVKDKGGVTIPVEATLCIKRLRYKIATEVQDDSIDFDLGQVILLKNGTNLGNHRLPEGTYSRLEVELDDKCPMDKSVSIANLNGSISTNDSISIRFEGRYSHESSGQKLNLAIQAIMEAISQITSEDDIKEKLEDVSGSF